MPSSAMSARTLPAALFVDRHLLSRIWSSVTRAERLAERLLQCAVEGLREVLHRRHGLDRIDDAVVGGDVDADRNTVLRQHFLAGHVERLALQVDDLHLHGAAGVPEAVDARFELAREDAVDEEQVGLAVQHRLDGDQARLARQREPAQQRRIDLDVGADVDMRHAPRTGIGPDHQLAVRRNHVVDDTVTLDDGDLRLARTRTTVR